MLSNLRNANINAVIFDSSIQINVLTDATATI